MLTGTLRVDNCCKPAQKSFGPPPHPLAHFAVYYLIIQLTLLTLFNVTVTNLGWSASEVPVHHSGPKQQGITVVGDASISKSQRAESSTRGFSFPYTPYARYAKVPQQFSTLKKIILYPHI